VFGFFKINMTQNIFGVMEENMKQIKEKIIEMAEIAKSCPENLQIVCFETLLKDYLTTLATLHEKGQKDLPAGVKKLKENETESKDMKTKIKDESKQEDIKESDLHVKMRKFMEKEGVTTAQINNLFYKEGDRILPLFDNFKTTKMSESQMHVTLLQCLVNALAVGEFQTQPDDVRNECTLRKCYDIANFMANFRNNKALFDSEKIDRKTTSLKLSDAGKKELANVIKGLQ
jgi:hypothetical protein